MPRFLEHPVFSSAHRVVPCICCLNSPQVADLPLQALCSYLSGSSWQRPAIFCNAAREVPFRMQTPREFGDHAPSFLKHIRPLPHLGEPKAMAPQYDPSSSRQNGQQEVALRPIPAGQSASVSVLHEVLSHKGMLKGSATASRQTRRAKHSMVCSRLAHERLCPPSDQRQLYMPFDDDMTAYFVTRWCWLLLVGLVAILWTRTTASHLHPEWQ